MKETLASFDTKLGNQVEEVSDIKTAIVKLTAIQEMQSANHDLSNQAMAKHLEVLAKIEARVQALEINTAPPKTPFWQTENGSIIIKAGIGILVIVLLAALGQTQAGVDVVKYFTGK
jgi:hypothetical protein